ncbi:hypothetical protein C8R43DRAFT_154402 [Mycena crocata]|nr:hypothetical protein C8R43DRAFT_154402 [Mycena crocata]
MNRLLDERGLSLFGKGPGRRLSNSFPLGTSASFIVRSEPSRGTLSLTSLRTVPCSAAGGNPLSSDAAVRGYTDSLWLVRSIPSSWISFCTQTGIRPSVCICGHPSLFPIRGVHLDVGGAFRIIIFRSHSPLILSYHDVLELPLQLILLSSYPPHANLPLFTSSSASTPARPSSATPRARCSASSGRLRSYPDVSVRGLQSAQLLRPVLPQLQARVER